MLAKINHSAGGTGKVDKRTDKGIYVSFHGPLHGSNFFPNSQVCLKCNLVFPTEAVAGLHAASGHKREYPYCKAA